MNLHPLLAALALTIGIAACAAESTTSAQPMPGPTAPVADADLPKDNAAWKQRLTPKQYYVLREQGTEAAFSGAFWNNHAAGTYHCAGCGEPLFASTAKFESGTGWPSFTQPLGSTVSTNDDHSHGMERQEVHCARCGGHLGHVFDDGPAPTGKRYCIDSAALTFAPTTSETTKPEPAKP